MSLRSEKSSCSDELVMGGPGSTGERDMSVGVDDSASESLWPSEYK